MSAQVSEPDSTVRLPVRKQYATLQKAAAHAPLAGQDKVVVLKVPAAMVRRAEATIDRSPLVGYIEALIPAAEDRPTGGPRRRLSVRVMCTGLLLLAMSEQPMILRDLVTLLNGLHPSTKWRLGIPRAGVPGEGELTERMVSRLFNNIADALDPSPNTPKNYQRHQDAITALRAAHAAAALEAAGAAANGDRPAEDDADHADRDDADDDALQAALADLEAQRVADLASG